jgi:oligopeptidase B
MTRLCSRGALLLLALLLTGATPEATAKPGENGKALAVGQKVTRGGTLRGLRGNRRPLHDFKGYKAIVLAFVGTECPLSNLYLPGLLEQEKTYRKKGVQFLAVYPNEPEDLDQIAAHASDRDMPFPVVKDAGQKLADHLGVTRVPAVVVLDGDFVLRYRGRVNDQYGSASRRVKPTSEDLTVALDEVLAGKKVSVPETEVDGCLLGRGAKKKPRADVTYSKHVAPILQKHCQTCHRPGQSAPFVLTSYESAVKHGNMIREVTAERRMPPWHADPRYGKFANDRRLSQKELDTLADWVAAGMPKGEDKYLPKPVAWVKGWMHGTPDLVIPMPTEFDVPATGTLPYKNFMVDPKFDEDRWVTIGEARPGSPEVVHHIVVYIQQGDHNPRRLDGSLAVLVGWAPGDLGLVCPPDTAMRVPKGCRLRIEMHYTPNGTATKDRSYIGLTFAKKPPRYEMFINEFGNLNIAIPPNDPHHAERACFRVRADSRILSFVPHMHWRGKDYRYEVVYPDGKRQTVLSVPRYDFNWQNVYRFAEPLKLPKGSKILSVAHWDNSRNNPMNPDPNKKVRFGLQTWEEMMVGWAVYVYERPETAVQMAKNPQSMADRLFDAFDVNGDDVLTPDEFPEQWRNGLKMMGVKVPAKVDRKQFAIAFEKLSKRFPPRRRPGAPRREPAKPAPAEKPAAKEKSGSGESSGIDPTAATPPVAEKVPHKTEIHDDVRIDNYFWLRNKKDSKVIDHLKAENTYTAAVMKPTETLQARLYKEMLGRIKQTDLQVPERNRGYWYYSRTEEGKQYPIFCRKKGNLDAAEEVILDVNDLAKGHKFFNVASRVVSDDGNLLAYASDTTGFREYYLSVKDLTTGKLIEDKLVKAPMFQWAKDNKTLFYVTQDHAKRPHKLWRHTIGEPKDKDVLVYEEKDELFNMGLGRSRDAKYLFRSSVSFTATEQAFLPTDEPAGEWKVIVPRKEKHEYFAGYRDGKFYIRTNHGGATNFKVVTCPVDKTDPEDWKELLPYNANVMVTGVALFRNHAVLSERENGLTQLRVLDLRNDKAHRVSFDEAVYTSMLMANPDYDTDSIRYGFGSLVTPNSVYEYNLDSRKRKLLKRQPVLGGYDPERYTSERIQATAADGTKVPISLVYKKGLEKNGTAPILLYGYGSYGATMPVVFNSNRVSLLDRGVVYAMAHIRGGSDLGREWYEQGRLRNKKNTFTDFIACADHLVKEKYGARDRLCIQGGSAGGLLVGAVLNFRPDLCKAAVMQVPFVDVINTMLDASLPLTVPEYKQWGNPNVKEDYAYMKTYCPYTNLAKKDYPSILVTTSLNDSQVMYWEPAKYVAKLRTLKTDANPLLFKCNMAAGHGGASGRYDALKEQAFILAFLLDRMGVKG